MHLLINSIALGAAWLLASTIAWATTEAQMPLAPTGQNVFRMAKPSVVQIRVMLKSTQALWANGSGFNVSADGLIVTNYHVVAEHALDPASYELKFVASDGQEGSLQLLAIDMHHDLALVKRSGSRLPYLQFNRAELLKGQRTFSLGLPKDMGLTISEGTYNGLRQHQLEDSIHFTGALNPGMSGGPNVTAAGKVIGVNSSRLDGEQLISFLSPASKAEKLLQNWLKNPVYPTDFHPIINQQLKQHSALLFDTLRISGQTSRKIGPYRFPDRLADYMNCRGQDSHRKEQFFENKSYTCMGNTDIYIGDTLDRTGKIETKNIVYSVTSVGPFHLSTLGEFLMDESFPESPGTRWDYTTFACQSRIVRLQGMPAKAALCHRSYTAFPDLHDISLQLFTLKESRRALYSRVLLTGVTFDAGMSFARRYMKAISWTN